MRRSVLSGVVLVLAGVAGGGCEVDEFQSALPSAEQVALRVPGGGGRGGGSGAGVGVERQALVGAVSEFYLSISGLASGVNDGTVGLIGMVEAITHTRPTTRTVDARTWGPWTPGGLDPLSYRLVARRLAPGQYGFSLEARPRASTADGDFLPLLDGEARPASAPRTGAGTMTMHFDNLRRVKPEACEQGEIAFVYDNASLPVTIDVTFHRWASNNPANPTCKGEQPIEATYAYRREDAGGGGSLRFAAMASIHKPEENKPLAEDQVIRSRWRADGAGRADVRITGGEVSADLAAAGAGVDAVSASQCWDGAFRTMYEAAAPPGSLVGTGGDDSACAVAALP